MSTATSRAAADVAEYRRRFDAARELMREHGFDGFVVGSGPPLASSSSISIGNHGRFAQPRYHRWFSGFHIFGAEPIAPQPVVVVLPLEGEPTLVVRAGQLGTWTTLARERSWIERIVGTYRDDRDWQFEANWGLSSPELPADVALALRDSGLDDARLGLVGSWPLAEETFAQLPKARFEPTLGSDENGELRDLLAPLLATNSAWEVERLERAQAAADAAIDGYMEAAAPGELVDRAVAEARYRGLREGAEDLLLEITSGTDPWSLWLAPNQPLGARYTDGDLVTVSPSIGYDGYWVQTPRTWLLGAPNTRQQAAFDTAERALDAMLARIEPGVTGGELWDVGVHVLDEAGFEPRGRLGHSVGFTLTTGPERFSILPGNEDRLEDGLAFVIHPCAYDKATGFSVQLGDSLLLENGAWRYLSERPRRYAP